MVHPVVHPLIAVEGFPFGGASLQRVVDQAGWNVMPSGQWGEVSAATGQGINWLYAGLRNGRSYQESRELSNGQSSQELLVMSILLAIDGCWLLPIRQ
jgi:hypothetical protein